MPSESWGFCSADGAMAVLYLPAGRLKKWLSFKPDLYHGWFIVSSEKWLIYKTKKPAGGFGWSASDMTAEMTSPGQVCW